MGKWLFDLGLIMDKGDYREMGCDCKGFGEEFEIEKVVVLGGFG